MARRRASQSAGGWLILLAILAIIAAVVGEDGGGGSRQAADTGPSADDPATFVILSGSENRALEDIVTSFCDRRGVPCRMEYRGSLDIGLAVADEGVRADAVWPANGIWIALYDQRRRVRDLEPVAGSPVILGVRRGKAEELGWIGRPVSTSDIVAAVRAGRLTYLATSATQSNSGAGAYLAMLSAALGSPDAITLADLERPDLRQTVGDLLKGITRTAGSSAWLKDLYLDSLAAGVTYDAMWNYEAVLAELNQELPRGAEPLYFIYPTDGVAFADSPLGFVERGAGEAKYAFFRELQAHLQSEDVQRQFQRRDRRPALGRATEAQARTEWNYDPTRPVTFIRMPEADVVRAALGLYQEVLRRPSLTFYCLDYSGSMEGDGERQLEAALRFLFDPEQAGALYVQHAAEDRIFVLPFDAEVRETVEATGARADQNRLLGRVLRESASGGTDMYACGLKALDLYEGVPDRGRYLPAIVMMTDGESQVELQGRFLDRVRAVGADLPVFGLTFGAANKDQLDEVAERTRGRVFDGTRDLREAFRAVRGYN